jgi:HAD superfamily hydrolase (TIGR01509 family)
MELRTPLQGILFDFDGLILDTETPVFQAWQEKFSGLGRQLLLEDWAEILGKANHELDQILSKLDDLLDESSRQTFLKEVSLAEMELVLQQRPLPGAAELIRKSHRAGLKLGIVSSSDREWVHSHLKRLKLLDYFLNTSCADDVKNAKPDPELYQLALEKMAIDPNRLVVLEDSPAGVLSAKRAGLYTIAVPNNITRQLRFSENGNHPDLVLESLEDFPWDGLMRDF